MKIIIYEIRSLLQADRLTEALDKLLHLIEEYQVGDKEDHKTILLLQSRLSNTKTDLMRGLISNAEADLSFNKIRNAILNLTFQFEETEIPPRPTTSDFHQIEYLKYLSEILAQLNRLDSSGNNKDIVEITKLELKRQDIIQEYINKEAKYFKAEAKYARVSLSLIDQIRSLLDELEITIGNQPVFMQVGGRAVKEDRNSTKVFAKLKGLRNQSQIRTTLAQLVGDTSIPIEESWKSLILLTYYKDEEALSQVKVLITRTTENRNINKFVHLDCVKYIDSITKISFQEHILLAYAYLIENCPTDEARSEAIKSLSRKRGSNSERTLSFFSNLINRGGDDLIRAAAVKGLGNFNLSNHKNDLVNWLSDPNEHVRHEASVLALKSPSQFNLHDIQNWFEVEGNYRTAENFVQLMLEKDRGRTIDYAKKVIQAGFDSQIAAILTIFSRNRICEINIEVENLVQNGFSLYQAKDYLKKCKAIT